MLKKSIVLLMVLMITSSVRPSASSADSETATIPNDMVYVSFGSFIMGIDKEVKKHSKKSQSLYEKRMNSPMSKDAFHDEGPAHEVTLDAYLIDKFETSNKLFGEFIKSTGHPAPAYWDDPRLNKAEQPVVGVNWEDAKAYCTWAGKRLPTEAEWEKAARGPQGYRYPWGNEFDGTKANYGGDRGATVPTEALPEGASAYGVFNMSGNVFEWVQDWYDPNYYRKVSRTSQVNPSGPEKPVWLGGTGTYVDRLTVGEKRVIRGGSWVAPQASLTTTHRFWNHPLNNSYGVGLGFRCAKEASPAIAVKIDELYIQALIKMGKEDFAEAKQLVRQGLDLAPSNPRLLGLQSQMTRTAQ